MGGEKESFSLNNGLTGHRPQATRVTCPMCAIAKKSLTTTGHQRDQSGLCLSHTALGAICGPNRKDPMVATEITDWGPSPKPSRTLKLLTSWLRFTTARPKKSVSQPMVPRIGKLLGFKNVAKNARITSSPILLGETELSVSARCFSCIQNEKREEWKSTRLTNLDPTLSLHRHGLDGLVLQVLEVACWKQSSGSNSVFLRKL